jgi:hypothetical protein
MSSDEPQRITFDVFKSAAASEFYNRITISDDHSSGSTVERRKLLALGKITNSDEYRSARSDNSLTSPFPSDPWEFPVHESGSSFHMEKAADRMTAVSTPSTETGAAAASQVALMTHKTTDAMEIPTVLMDLRNVLQGASISQLHLQKLQDYIAFLQSNNQRGGVEKKQPSFRHQIFYRIWESVGDPSKNDDTLEDQLSVPYFDHPVWARGDGRASRMRCEIPLENFELYLEKNKDVAFIVYRDFQTGSMDNAASYPVTHLPRHSSEKIQPINRDLITAIVDLLSSRDEYAKLLEMYLESNKLPAPYLFIYHSRTSLEEFQDGLTLPAKTQLSLLSKYVTEQFAHEYAAADDLLSQNKILPEYVHYLFKPGDLLVSKVGNEYTGHVATSWPQVRESKRELRMPFTGSRNCKEPRPDGVKDDASAHKMRSSIRAWHWEFDGNFQRRFETLELEILDSENRCGNATNTEGVEKESRESNPQARATKISDLNVFPVQYASLEITEKCRRRGKNFWNCRHRRYVSYQESEVGNFHSVGASYLATELDM